MSSNEESAVQEIVIIRRRSGEEEGAHKGGVWKIAYADFMTAMMAFFLVMWLINATDKKVITQIATYFNPLRLTDKAPTPKGMHDAGTGAPGEHNTQGESKQKEGRARASKIGPAEKINSEEALFKDPYDTLEKIAEQGLPSGSKEQKSGGEASRQAQGTLAVGEAFRDPFEPDYQRRPRPQIVEEAASPLVESKQTPTVPEQRVLEGAAGEKATIGQAPRDSPGQLPQDQALPPPAIQERPAEQAKAESAKDSDATKIAAEAAARAKKLEEEQAQLAKLDQEIRQALSQIGSGELPDVEVKVTEEGLLISLTDKFDFGMFAIASAEPRPAMVAVMEKIAKVLQSRPGRIIVRGHTDGRPFRSANYDNWRLSSARAQMAYYMLVRGGIDEKRFERIEGHADRSLRVPEDPDAAQNRRIELLLRVPKS